ncbi:MFS transporter [Sphaerisporangium melleum]|uniref:MFS transporter n=1 Tax=Sphaerisporangium melleum TaxID=321316 RepID=A0A917QRY8_9ACTN|nr:MFS transporter [Sphaerisporangium melleum]GGK65405.1 MFS transporter [Sphaerisporangium melleum]GII69963.1 MFS transporter [Sphaerisporangium melleum]
MAGKTSSHRLTFAVLSAAAASFAMLQSLVGPVLPTIQHDLATTQSAVTWVLTAWLVSASVATPLLGRIGDMLGKDRTLLVALGAIALGSLVAALAPTIEVLIAGRVIQGLGGAVFPLSFGIIRDEFPPERVSGAVGGLSAVLAVGGGLGTLIAGPIVQLLNWRWLFWIPMVVVAATAVLAHRYIPRSPVRTEGRVAWPAAALLSGWLVALLIPLSNGAAWGWTSLPVITLLVLAVLAFAGWIAVETRSSAPLVDMRMMRLPAVWTTNLVALLFGAGMFSVVAFVPIFVQIPSATGYGFGSSVTEAGLMTLPMLVTMAVAGGLSGPISPVIGAKAQLVWGSVLCLVACLLLAAYHDRPWQIALAEGIIGIGIGLAYAAMTGLIVRSVPAHQTGVAGGMNANIRTIGGSIGTAVVGTVIASGARPDGLPQESGFTYAFLLLAACAAVTVALTLLVPAARRAPAHQAAPGEALTGATR